MPLAKDCLTQLIDSTSGHYSSTGYCFLPAYSMKSPGIRIRSTQWHNSCHEVACPPPPLPEAKCPPGASYFEVNRPPLKLLPRLPGSIPEGHLFTQDTLDGTIAWCPHYRSSTVGSTCTYNGFSNSLSHFQAPH